MVTIKIERVAAFPQPRFYSLGQKAYMTIFEEDRAAAMASEEAAATFLEMATDVEALLVMSEVSLSAPLNDEGYHLMMHLSHRVFTRAGVPNIPDFVLNHETLSQYHQSQLDRFRREIRSKQGKLTNKEKRNVII